MRVTSTLASSPHRAERLHVAKRLGQDVARAGEPGFLTAADRRAAETDRDAGPSGQ